MLSFTRWALMRTGFFTSPLTKHYNNEKVREKVMTAFAIRVVKSGKPDSFYVGEDAVLWDWFVADNFRRSLRPSRLTVEAPPGYVFRQDALYSLLPEEKSKRSLRTYRIKASSPQNDKALLLIEALVYVTSAKFSSLGIDPARVADCIA